MEQRLQFAWDVDPPNSWDRAGSGLERRGGGGQYGQDCAQERRHRNILFGDLRDDPGALARATPVFGFQHFPCSIAGGADGGGLLDETFKGVEYR